MPAAKDPLHAHVDALMAERKLDVLLLTGNTPENPNFYTDFIMRGVAMTSQLKGHPRFKELERRFGTPPS